MIRECPLRFPCVMKPAKGAGSWHVRRIDELGALRDTWHELNTQLQCGSFPGEVKSAGFIIEEYINGCEVDVDGWAENGVLQHAVVSDNHNAIEPYFCEV